MVVTEKPVLVTGVSGWVASHTMYQLLEAGYKVRGTVRDVGSDKAKFVQGLHPAAKENLELVACNLLKPEGWKEAVKGCDYVLHIASPFHFAASEADLVGPAVEGVRNCLTACCEDGGVKRVVLTSSVVSAVFGHPAERFKCDKEAVEREIKEFNAKVRKEMMEAASGKKAEVNDENEAASTVNNKVTDEGDATKDVKTDGKTDGKTDEMSASFRNSLRTSNPTGTEVAGWKLMNEEDWTVPENVKGYELSKVLAEKEAWKIIEAHNAKPETTLKIELVTICPGFVFGPIFGKEHISGESSTHILNIMKKTYPRVPPINSAHVDVRDVAMCHILAMEGESDKVANQRFMCTCDDGNIDFVEQSTILKEFFGNYGHNIVTKSASSFLLFVGSLFMSRVAVAYSKIGDITYTSNNKTHDQLGMTKWRPVGEALRSHALTLMKYEALPSKKVPKDMIENYTPY